LIKEEFNEKISEFEEIIQKIASDVASGAIFEKLPPSELLNKTEHYVNSLRDLATENEETIVILKPEKAYTVKALCKKFTQTLTTFKDILLQKSPDPLANSRLAFEQLRKALTDGSDLLILMRDIRDNPSPLMDALITLKKTSETKGPVISIQASEETQPLIKYVLGHLDELRATLMGLEKKVGEMKQIMRELQEESLKTLSNKTPTEPKKNEGENRKRQLSLSNFKKE
jgi:sugar-specific transcriptional regulator TrmB